MKKCPYCGFDNDEQAETCKHCKAGFHTEEDNTNDEPETLTVSKKKKRSETNGT